MGRVLLGAVLGAGAMHLWMQRRRRCSCVAKSAAVARDDGSVSGVLGAPAREASGAASIPGAVSGVCR